MIKIAITGGIGSGKSYVCHALAERGIPVYIADDEAKRLTASDPLIRRQLIALVGPDVYAGGTFCKARLAEYLFADPSHVLAVNAIIHPRVKDDFAQWALRQEAEGARVVGIESAILYEAGFRDAVDAVVMVYAPRALRLERAMQRDGATRQQVEQRMAHQMDDEEKRWRAEYVVTNDGTQPVGEQLDALILRLMHDF
jgi:dephospho-CoA kinase